MIPKSLALFLCALLLAPPAQAQTFNDTITISSGQAKAGGMVTLPISISDELGTLLGIDGGAGRQIQSLALKLDCQPSSYVESININRSGVLTTLAPLYERSQSFASGAWYMAVFDEATQPIVGLWSPGKEVAKAVIVLSDIAPKNTVISVNLDAPRTILSNQTGTRSEQWLSGNLMLKSGSIKVTAGSSKPLVSLKALTAKATERGKRARIRIHRTGSKSKALPVRLTFSGQAKPGKDFRKVTKSLVIAKGKSDAEMEIIPIKNTKKNGLRDAVVTIAASQSYGIIPPGRVTVIISD